MRRIMPLIKIVLRLLVFGLAMGAVLGLVFIIAFDGYLPAPAAQLHRQIVLGETMQGAILGGLTGLALAVYAGALHRVVNNASSFKFAFVIVAMIVSLLPLQSVFHVSTFQGLGASPGDWLPWVLSDPQMAALLFATIIKQVALGLMSAYAAGRYLKEA